MFKLLLVDDTAQGLVEYAMVVALIALAAVASLKLLGHRDSGTLRNAAAHR